MVIPGRTYRVTSTDGADITFRSIETATAHANRMVAMGKEVYISIYDKNENLIDFLFAKENDNVGE